MNLNYAIFRSEPIMTIPDLSQIGAHNKREKKAYQSNKDIKIEPVYAVWYIGSAYGFKFNPAV